MSKALEGVTVIDLSRVLAGPYCTMFLADMGAEVIKIEVPRKGDDTRGYAPAFRGESAYFINLNRNKKSVTLNLKSPEGKQILKDLVAKADILIENFRPGTMDRLGLGYDVLKKINPKLVYGAISGFGQYGPYSERPGYDIIGQAMGGLMSTTGWPGGPPTRSGTAIADVLAGLSLTVGVEAAYISAQRTGVGQMVDVALVDSVVSALEIINQIYLASGRIPERIGNRYEATYPYDSFEAKDGHMVIAAGNNKLYQILCDVMEKPELKDDPRFLNVVDRVENHSELKPIIEDWLKDYTIDEAVDIILEAGCPAAPINTIDRVVADPHISEAREMFVELPHPTAGNMKICGNQIKLSETPVQFNIPAPLLSEHTYEVLSEKLGMTPETYESLKEKGVL